MSRRILVSATLLIMALMFDFTVRAQIREVQQQTLSEEEIRIIEKASRQDASREEKVKALDICAKKCKICFDGIRCDPECVRKNCSR
jgi:hypothetical protein